MGVLTHLRTTIALTALVAFVSGCGGDAGPSAPPPGAEKPSPRPVVLRDEIPPDQLDAVLKAHLQGLGHMERYEYADAARAFRDAHDRAPGWIAGSINLAVALLNQSGTAAEKDNNPAGGQAPPGNFEQALERLDAVIVRDPKNPSAHYCRGLILEFQGEIARAHRDFATVTELDPNDAHAWLRFGSTLTDPDDPGRPAGPKQAKRLVEIYTRALECNPYLVSTLYKLQTAYAWSGDRAKQKEVIALWDRLYAKRNPAGPGDSAESSYGETGRYARVINPFPSPKVAEGPVLPPQFDPPAPLDVRLAEGSRWATSADLKVPMALLGRARARFGAGVATFDADGDGKLDLYLTAAVVGPKGVRDALLLNRGDGKFEEVALAYGLPEDRASLGVAAGDFDADRKVDLYLTGVGDNRLYRNLGKRFADITKDAGLAGEGAISPSARWLDLDQDGDLDLYVIRYTDGAHAEAAFNGPKPPPGRANAAYRNDGKPAPIAGRPEDNWAPLAVAPDDLPATAGLSIAFAPWPDAEALSGGVAAHTAVAALDLDDDRDFDLVLWADGQEPRAVLNDRLGRFHAAEMDGLPAPEPVSGALVADLDKDGLADLVAVSPSGRVSPFRNTTERTSAARSITWEAWPTDAKDWRGAVAADLDLDTWADLVGLPASGESHTVAWARNDGRRLTSSPLALPPGNVEPRGVDGFALADLVGDPLPDLVVVGDGEAPRLARNLGNGRHWLSLTLGGRWKTSFDHMRTNPHGLGARLSLEGRRLDVPYDHTTTQAGLAQSVGPFVLGLGPNTSAALLRIRWPDGTMQCELNVAADQKLALMEHNRKTGSCPVLFTWDGARFACLGDFLGGGGLGYLVAPGIYGQPDRDEAVAIEPDQLKPVDGSYRLVITEPMDEVAYLDKLVLEVVDRPPGLTTAPDERFAPEGPRPTGEILAWRPAIEPVAATDLKGVDVTETLRARDRKTVDGFRRLHGWIGYAEEHGIVLDFGDRLSAFGPDDRLVLGLAGWVEYPYSQTNYAASTAGVTLRPPTLERLRDDGRWEEIVPHAGYPAGLPRLTTLDLTGKLIGPRCILRLRTNMECYWDQAFISVIERDPKHQVTALPVSRAVLGYRGYLREVSPDGRLPLLYDYDYVDPAPLARMSGRLTRTGDVAPLLRDDDDQLCLVGPGDEVRLEFDAKAAPPLPEGWTRAFILRSVGYCKDADPFTAASDSIGPLPWREMPPFPFGPEGERPMDASYREYLRTYQTRTAGGEP